MAHNIHLCRNIARKTVVMVKMLGINIGHHGYVRRSGCIFKLMG